MTDAHERLREALRDRYLIERELGAGGMATVFLARDIKHDRDVAIKLLKPELAASIGADRFLREIRTTAQLQHPHIMPLFDSGSADGLLYYVMPLIQGESLADYLERTGPLPIDEAIRIVRQIAGALDFAHRKGLVHRDIKPENILLHDGEALLADFGIAVGTRETGNDRLTGTGFSLGSPRYMSPEQAVGERDIDARADIYSLGAVTYEIVSGVPPVTGTSAQSMLAKLLTEKPKLLKEVRTDAPDALDAAVMRALEKQPADRFATAREFADALTTMSPTSATRTASSKANAANEAPASRLTAPRSRATIVGALVAIVAIVAVGAYFGLRKPTVALESIAVLPLENRTKDSTQDYFVEGITDELTGQLATIKQLRVTSRGSAMSFTGKNKPAAPEIAKALNVDAIVQGAVSRHGDTVHVSVELIDARQDRQLWQGSYDRKSSDVLLLQAELAKLIAEKINVQLTSSEETRLSAVQTVNPQSHEAYLKGRYFFNRPSDENLQKAIAQFEEAVRLSPTFAPAYSGLSDAYLWAGYNEGLMTASEAKPKARAAAEMAVKLDSMSAEAHASLATFKTFYEFDWPGAEKEFRRAIALNPNYGFAHDQLGMTLAFTGHADESIVQGKNAIAIDPLSPQILVDATLPYFFSKNFDGGLILAMQAGELDPTYFFPVMIEGWIHLEEQKFGEAVTPLLKARTLGAPPFVTAFLGFAYGKAGDRKNALAQMDSLKAMAKGAAVLPFNLALIHLGLGENKLAIDYLERALAGDSQMMAWIGQDHMFDSLRQEPRFIELLKRMHFVQ